MLTIGHFAEQFGYNKSGETISTCNRGTQTWRYREILESKGFYLEGLRYFMDGKMKGTSRNWEKKTSKRQAVTFLSSKQLMLCFPLLFFSLAHLQRFRTDKCLIFSYWSGGGHEQRVSGGR